LRCRQNCCQIHPENFADIGVSEADGERNALSKRPDLHLTGRGSSALVIVGLARAQRVLDRVLQALPAPSRPSNWRANDVFCLVYRQPEHYDDTLGLRHVVEND
jgi:hypothetical protein